MKESQLKSLIKAIIKESICPACNGSGEGRADGTRCLSCKGSGVEGYRGELTKRNDPDYDWDREHLPDDEREHWMGSGMDETSNSPFGMNRKDRRDLSKKLAGTDTSAADRDAKNVGMKFLQKTNPSAAYKLDSEKQRKDFLKSLGAKMDEGYNEQPIYKDRQGGSYVYWMDNRDTGGRIQIKPEAVARMVKRGHRVIELDADPRDAKRQPDADLTNYLELQETPENISSTEKVKREIYKKLIAHRFEEQGAQPREYVEYYVSGFATVQVSVGPDGGVRIEKYYDNERLSHKNKTVSYPIPEGDSTKFIDLVVRLCLKVKDSLRGDDSIFGGIDDLDETNSEKNAGRGSEEKERSNLIGQISDDYKSVYGIRPRRDMSGYSIEELRAMADSLSADIQAEMDREKRDKIQHATATKKAMTPTKWTVGDITGLKENNESLSIDKEFEQFSKKAETTIFPHWIDVLKNGQYEFAKRISPTILKLPAFQQAINQFGKEKVDQWAFSYAQMLATQYYGWARKNQMTTENIEGGNPNLINGQSNAVAVSRVNKILASASRGMFSDDSWEAIHNIFKKLREAGLEVSITNARYGGHNDVQSGMPKFKEWQISIPFTNKNGKQVELVGNITAHGAGSVDQPLDRYDITAYVSPKTR